ncbi:MAG: AAA family ATPase [Lachnoclostridium sp.]
MQLLELRLNDFGKFHNKQITLKEGINLIYGENEAGKSTIHAFIKGMLFGIEKSRGRVSKADVYEKYKPWDNPGAYHGSMDIKVGGKIYRIIRNFDKNNKSCSIMDMETGREYGNNPDDLALLLNGLTESGFRNTISVEQLKSRTDQELAGEVRNYIANLSLAKSNEVDVTKALSFLADKKKELEAENADEKLQALREEMEEIKKQEIQAEALSSRLKEIEEQEEKLLPSLKIELAKLKNQLEYLDKFQIVKVKYQNYKEAKEQKKSIEDKQADLMKNLSKYREGLTTKLREKINEFEQVKEKIAAKEEERDKYLRDYEAVQSKWEKLRSAISLIFGLTGFILFLCFMGKNILLSGLGVISLLCGVTFYLYEGKNLNRRRKSAKEDLRNKEQVINSLNKKRDSILEIFQVKDEKMLKLMYEDALKQEMSIEHLKEQSVENQKQEKILEGKIYALEWEIREYLNGLKENCPDTFLRQPFTDEGMDELQAFIFKQKESVNEKIEFLNRQPDDLRIRKEKLKWELKSLEGWEDKFFEKQQLYQELMEQKIKNDLELKAVRLSIETINSLSADIHDSFGKELNELVSSLSSQLTGQRYSDIKVDEKMNVKAGYKDRYVLINSLSAGTIEQLYLALRLAVGELIYGPGMPVLIDDGFALYDDKRAAKALGYLADNRKGQVILFTCHNREKDILDRLNMDYHYIDLSC